MCWDDCEAWSVCAGISSAILSKQSAAKTTSSSEAKVVLFLSRVFLCPCLFRAAAYSLTHSHTGTHTHTHSRTHTDMHTHWQLTCAHTHTRTLSCNRAILGTHPRVTWPCCNADTRANRSSGSNRRNRQSRNRQGRNRQSQNRFFVFEKENGEEAQAKRSSRRTQHVLPVPIQGSYRQ